MASSDIGMVSKEKEELEDTPDGYHVSSRRKVNEDLCGFIIGDLCRRPKLDLKVF